MNKELKYKGHTAAPSDYECPDGELSVLMDLWPENGAIKPVLKPQELLQLSYGQRVMYLHSVPNGTHYIILDTPNNSLYWCNEGSSSLNIMTSTGLTASSVLRITGIGNTIIVLTTSGMRYYLWKNNAYLYLGTEIPELPISFGLQATIEREDESSFVTHTTQTGTEITEENRPIITAAVMANVNKFVADKATNAGKFMFPFFVRYAYRLYNGDIIKHSTPVLMLVSDGQSPLVALTLSTTIRDDYRVFGVACQLDYCVETSGSITALRNWGDIVKSVDIFITSPIYTYDQAGEIKRYYTITDGDSGSRGMFKITQTTTPAGFGQNYQLHNIAMVSDKVYTDTWHLSSWLGFELPTKDISSNIENGTFYFLKSISLDSLSTSRTVISISDDYLPSLVNREVMKDDYDSHDKLIPSFAYPYNSRLNLANISKVLFAGWDPGVILNYTAGDEWYDSPGYSEGATETNRLYIKYRVHINQGGKAIISSYDSSTSGMYGSLRIGDTYPYFYFFYPNTNAVKLTIEATRAGTSYVQTFEMKQHPYLNGSYYAAKNLNLFTGSATLPSISGDRSVSIDNKIYTSEVNNPFVFPVTNINTIGTGKILAISTAAKALSQGQFGEFPLYAFTEDGVWALEVSSAGGYSAKQPITRDVILNADALTQIDNAVLFATERGVMIISGSQLDCLTDYIDNKNDPVFSLNSLPQASTILLGSGQTDPSLSFAPFRTFLAGCKMLYDYTSQRIILFNSAYSYSYIYSINQKQWGMMRSNITHGVNSYPECLAITSDNKLVDFSKRISNTSPSNQILITRPIKMDLPDALKTITSIIQRGVFANGKVKTLLYGSRDLNNWFPVFSSTNHYLRGFHGTPYKYFRIALKCTLADGETLSGCSIDYETKLTDKTR